MIQTTTISAQIESDIKTKGDVILAELGFSPSDAIAMLYHGLIEHQGLPFEAYIPNEETIAAFEEAKDESNLVAYPDVKSALDDIWGDD